MKLISRWRPLLLLLFLLLGTPVFLTACQSEGQPFVKPKTRFTANEPEQIDVEVLSIVDGDTIRVDLDGENTKVRLIGINCPESVHSDPKQNMPEGEEATAFIEQFLIPGERVTLVFDVERTDRYGRILAYVGRRGFC